MPVSSHQTSRLAEEADHYDSLRNSVGGSTSGTCPVASEPKMTFFHETHGDILFIDLHPSSPGDNIEVIEIGDQVGFPGQIQARVNREKKILYGLTVQKYSAVKRSLFWNYRMPSPNRALSFLVGSIQAGLCMQPGRAASAW